MDFKTWKKGLEDEGIMYRSEPFGPFLIFYSQKDVPLSTDFNALFAIIGKNSDVTEVKMESHGGSGYTVTVEISGAINIIVDANPSKGLDTGELMKLAESKVSQGYESQAVNEKLQQIRRLISQLNEINWGIR